MLVTPPRDVPWMGIVLVGIGRHGYFTPFAMLGHPVKGDKKSGDEAGKEPEGQAAESDQHERKDFMRCHGCSGGSTVGPGGGGAGSPGGGVEMLRTTVRA